MKQRRSAFRGILLSAACLAAGQATAHAADRHAALDLLPAETLAFYYGMPVGATFGPAGALEWVSRGVEIAGHLGRLPAQTRLTTDLLGRLPLLGRYPHVVALLDIDAERLADDVYRLASLRAVLILQTGGDNEAVERHIRAILSSQTNSDISRLAQVSYEGVTVHRLVDSRVPTWAVVEWAAFGDFYIVGVGDGALRQVLGTAKVESSRLSSDNWFEWAYSECRGPQANVMWLVRFGPLRSRLSRVIRGRPEKVIEALGAAGVEQSFWSIGRTGRAITAYCAQRVAGRDHVMRISDPAATAPDVLAAVPPEAPTFAVIEGDLRQWIRRLSRAYLASQAVVTAERIRTWWSDVQDRLGIDVETELLGQLGRHLVIHTYPEHPWRVPLLCTLFLEIKGDAAKVRHCIDQLMGAWQQALAGGAQNGQIHFGPQLRRSDDGIWYLEFGALILFGLAVEDQWIIVSYSPQATLKNVMFLRDRRAGSDVRAASSADRQPSRAARGPGGQ